MATEGSGPALLPLGCSRGRIRERPECRYRSGGVRSAPTQQYLKVGASLVAWHRRPRRSPAPERIVHDWSEAMAELILALDVPGGRRAAPARPVPALQWVKVVPFS